MEVEIIATIFEICIIPILGALTAFFIKWVNAKSKEIQTSIDDATLKKYINMLEGTITSCVIATNQTYVDSLKQQNKFDAAAQEEAFRRTSEAVLAILSEEAKQYLSSAFGDLETYIVKKIESEVKINKN